MVGAVGIAGGLLKCVESKGYIMKEQTQRWDILSSS